MLGTCELFEQLFLLETVLETRNASDVDINDWFIYSLIKNF